jgi:hypothetical protein
VQDLKARPLTFIKGLNLSNWEIFEVLNQGYVIHFMF